MTKRKVYFKLDCSKPGVQHTVEGLHVGDKRSCEMHILLRNGITPLIFDDSNIAIIVNAQKPDGTTISSLCDISSDKKEVIYTLDEQDTAVAGVVSYELIVASCDGSDYYILYSATFETVVTEGIVTPVFKKLDTQPDDWTTSYQKYFRLTENGYVKISDDVCPDFSSDDFYYLINPNYESVNDYSAFEKSVANVRQLLGNASELYRRMAEAETNITNEVAARVGSVNALGNRISDEATIREATDTTLRRMLLDESTARTAADTALGNRIDALSDTVSEKANSSDVYSKAQTDAKLANKTDVSRFVQYQAQVQQELDNKVDSAEFNDYQSTTRQSFYNEAKTRAQADNALNGRIDDLDSEFDSKADKTYVDSMDDKIKNTDIPQQIDNFAETIEFNGKELVYKDRNNVERSVGEVPGVDIDKLFDTLDDALSGDSSLVPALFVKSKGDNYALVYADSKDEEHELFDFTALPAARGEKGEKGDSVTHVEIRSDGVLYITIENASQEARVFPVGTVVGAKGADGANGNGYDNAEINQDGDLIVREVLGTGASREVNLGHVVGAQGVPGETGAKGDKGDTGAAGADGNAIWKTTVAPTAPAAPEKPGYGFNVTDLTGADREVQIGDIVLYSYYYYGITQIVGSVAYAETRVSIRGARGAQGPQGDDYVLTTQDKTDIANIVLSELPTTEGVLYGNTSN